MLLSYGRALSALELAAFAREQADSAEREIHPVGTPPRWAASVMTFGMCQVEAYHSEEEASRAVIREILTAAAEAMASRGRFVLVIPGGKTFLEASHLLTTDLLPQSLSSWHVFMTDEHMKADEGALGPNARTALQSGGWGNLIRTNRMRATRFHAVHVDRHGGGTALATAARDYETAYVDALAGAAGADLVVAGVGVDCHMASILPERFGWASPLLGIERRFSEVAYPHEYSLPVPARVTITLRAMSDARQLVLFCTGRAKADAVARALLAAPDPRVVPASFALLRPSKLVCDSTCASFLSSE